MIRVATPKEIPANRVKLHAYVSEKFELGSGPSKENSKDSHVAARVRGDLAGITVL